MRIVFCAYADINFRARELEELACLEAIGNVHIVTAAVPDQKEDGTTVSVVGERNYLRFQKLCMRAIKQIKPELIFLHDNFCAQLIPYIKRVVPSCVIVYDMSELYIGRIDGPKLTWKAKWLQREEFTHLPKVDFTIAANDERALIAKGYFGLKAKPFVLDNVHRILDEPDFELCDGKYGNIFKKSAFNVIYAGGLAQANTRGTHGLLKAMTILGDDYNLIVAGADSNDDSIHSLIESNPYNNVKYVGKVPRGDLRYLYSKSELNIVTFDASSINNIYCASGKQFEGIFEGLPLLASPNPPVARLCEERNIGVVMNSLETEEFVIGLKKARELNDIQRNHASEFAEELLSVDRLSSLKSQLCALVCQSCAQ